jgi:hypothetical protein
MSDRPKETSDDGAQRNQAAHKDEIGEALVRDAELYADPALAISLKQLDEWIRDRQSRSMPN